MKHYIIMLRSLHLIEVESIIAKKKNYIHISNSELSDR